MDVLRTTNHFNPMNSALGKEFVCTNMYIQVETNNKDNTLLRYEVCVQSNTSGIHRR